MNPPLAACLDVAVASFARRRPVVNEGCPVTAYTSVVPSLQSCDLHCYCAPCVVFPNLFHGFVWTNFLPRYGVCRVVDRVDLLVYPVRLLVVDDSPRPNAVTEAELKYHTQIALECV